MSDAIFLDEFDRTTALSNAKTWMYLIQKLDEPGKVESLSATEYPFVVVEPNFTNKGQEDFDVRGMVEKLRFTPSGKRRLVIAYIDIGEAENYRSYWKNSWIEPTKSKTGEPSFLVAPDPDGWSGNFPVLFWDNEWQSLWVGEEGFIQQLAEIGFDGVYLDWVEDYAFDPVSEAAQKAGKNPAQEMVEFIRRIRRVARQITPDFLLIGQNAPGLLMEAPDYAQVIDGAGFEDIWFKGLADAEWNDPRGGDIPTDPKETETRVKQATKFLEQDISVFTIDYSLKPDVAAQVYRDSRSYGFVPLVSRVSLSRVTETPPPD
jgi:cysteinyl-tRNA synthetase